MSLINQVLQDLDQRAAGSGNRITPALQTEAKKNTRGKRYLVLLVACAAIAVVAWLVNGHFYLDAYDFYTVRDKVEKVAAAQQNTLVEQNETAVVESVVAENSKNIDAPLLPVVSQKQVSSSGNLIEVETTPSPKPSVTKPVKKIVQTINVTEKAWYPVEPPVAVQVSVVESPAPKLTPPKVKKVEISAVKVPKANSFKQARQLIDKGRFVEAEPLLQSFVKANPNRLDAVELLIGVYLRDGRVSDAKILIEQALLADSENPSLLLIQANILVEEGETYAAIEQLMPAVVAPKPEPEVLRLLGALLQQSARLSEAVIVYDQLVKHVPSDGSAWLGLALALDGLNQDGAAEAYQQSLNLGGVTQAAAVYARDRLVILSGG